MKPGEGRTGPRAVGRADGAWATILAAFSARENRPEPDRSPQGAYNDGMTTLYDLIVVGAGMGGLALAALAQRQGLRVALLEAHTRLGGCAGWFDRGPYTFDVGATALMGLGPGEPIGRLVADLSLEVEAVTSPVYRVHLPDRRVDIVGEADRFEANQTAAFPGRETARRRFWRIQAAVGETLFRAVSGGPRFPVRSPGDLVHDLRLLGGSGLAAAATSLLTVDDVLGLLGLASDRPFRTFVAMLLQDTAQAGPETVPFANAAACLQAYRRGLARPRGGMRAWVEGLGRRFVELGGELRRATLVDRVEPANTGNGTGAVWAVTTRRRESWLARHVAFNLPIDLAAALLGRRLEGRLGRMERRSRAVWSAVTGYVVMPRDAVDDETPLFHQVLQDAAAPIHDGNNVLVSLSPPGDLGYGPESVRVATMSTHVRPADWSDLTPEAHAQRKQVYRDRLLAALERAIPGAEARLLHAEFGTPRSFRRYTRRSAGAVGGPPVSRWNSNVRAVGCDELGPGLWLVGDSVFPGQGTMAVVVSAQRVVERIIAEQSRTGRPKTPAKRTEPARCPVGEGG